MIASSDMARAPLAKMSRRIRRTSSPWDNMPGFPFGRAFALIPLDWFDDNLPLQSPVDRTMVGDFQKSLTLFRFKGSSISISRSMESILAPCGFALLTVRSMNLTVFEAHHNGFQGPLFAVCIHAEGHPRAGAKSGYKVVIGRGTRVRPTNRYGFVCHESVAVGYDLRLIPPSAVRAITRLSVKSL